jgi:hypothetical protein
VKPSEAVEVPMRCRRLILAVCTVFALTAATACETTAQPGETIVSASASSSDSPAANEPPQLSASHRALALAAAHQDANKIAVGRNEPQVAGWPSGIHAVTAVVQPGTVSDTNTGHTCQSGEIIAVQLVGAFETVVAGTPTSTGTSSPDTTVREIDLSVDATTGLTCLISVRIEPVPPGAGATILYNR